MPPLTTQVASRDASPTCTRHPTGSGIHPKSLFPRTSSNLAQERVWGSSARNVFIGGSSGQVYRWDGSDWIHEASGVNTLINGFWSADGSEVFASSAGGNITRR